jgi:hypothetical protein
MTAAALLQAVRSRGAMVVQEHGRLRVRPRAVVRDLEPELRRRARELSALVTAEAQPRPLRVVVDCTRDVPGPVRLSQAVTAIDVPLAVQSMLSELMVTARRYAAHDARAEEYGEQLEKLIGDLERLGCRARVVEG